MTITIARARRDDAFACAALRLRSDLEEGHPNRAGFVTEYADDFLSAFDEVPTWIATRSDGTVVGKVTSGGPSPTLGRNIAMAYVPARLAALGTELKVIVRGKPAAAEVVAMPFVAQRYYRKPKA